MRLSALDPAPAKNVDVDANGTLWTPAAVNLNAGDSITWRFGASAGSAHDVWLVPPGGDPSPTGPDLVKVSDVVFPGGAPVSRTLTQTGTYSFICRLHAAFTGGAWNGMIGTAAVTAAGGSGVGATEYRVDGGDWVRNANTGGASPFATAFTVTAEGQHTVEYRSSDNAGNVEATRSVAFGIEAPEPGFPVIEAFADPRSGSAPLLVRYSATGFDPDGGRLAYKWEFENGSVFDAAVDAHVHAGRHLHGEADRDRRRGRHGDQGGRRHRHRSRRAAADGRGERGQGSGGPAPLLVRFSATGDDPDGPEEDLHYRWEFGDGGTSFERNPSHTYMQKGSYQAKVTVSDASGATAAKTLTIVAADPPGNVAPSVQADALPRSGSAPLEVQLSAAGTDPDGDALRYSWDFGDGSASATGATATHTYERAGAYTATGDRRRRQRRERDGGRDRDRDRDGQPGADRLRRRRPALRRRAADGALHLRGP